MDSASMSSFITEELASRLQLKQESISLSIRGIDEIQTNVSRSCDVLLFSSISTFKTKVKCLILRSITSKLPSVSFDSNFFDIPSYIKLADPTFSKKEKIDMLLGAGVFWSLLTEGKRNLGATGLVLQNSKLGWFMYGDFSDQPKEESGQILCHLSRDAEIQTQLQRFWEIEECQSKKPLLSDEERRVEEHFQETFHRTQGWAFCRINSLERTDFKARDISRRS